MTNYGGCERTTLAASPQACFDALTDYEHLADWQGALKSVEVLERYPDGALVVYALDAKVRTVRYTLRLEHDSPHRIGSRYVEGDFRTLQAEWRFTERPDAGTDVVLELELDPGAASSPARCATWCARWSWVGRCAIAKRAWSGNRRSDLPARLRLLAECCTSIEPSGRTGS